VGLAEALGYDPVGGVRGVSGSDEALGAGAREALRRYPTVVVHCSGPRWAAQKLDPAAQSLAIGSVDEHVVRPLAEQLGQELDRIAVVGLHRIGETHVGIEAGAAPFLVTDADTGRHGPDRFDEVAAGASALVARDAEQLREFVFAAR
jgi:2,3-bisphosphoglycerate-independent phosphoglycerate mutase